MGSVNVTLEALDKRRAGHVDASVRILKFLAERYGYRLVKREITPPGEVAEP